MSDDAFHEIQLNGKQLVFLFMAATVVSVVIFLCGVLVGRGVRAEKVETLGATAAATVAPDPAAASMPEPAPAAPPSNAPPAPPDELTYYDRLQREQAPAENLKPVEPEERAAPPAASVEIPPPAVAPASLPSEPAGSGFAVQVAAFRERQEADSILQRLIGKGYPAYVLAPVKGAPVAVYRVRVGKFKTRREAEDVAGRLEKEEQFKPWLIR